MSQIVENLTVRLTLPVKLAPTPEQASALLSTVERFNAACDWLAGVAFGERCANKVALQKIAYYETRERFGLAAQLSIRAIGKTVEAYKPDKTIRPRFRPHGAVPYDERIMSWKSIERVSLLTLDGRAVIPVVLAPYQAARLDRQRGQADLVYRAGTFYLYVTVEVPEPPVQDVPDYLGVDLGIVNLAVDPRNTSRTCLACGHVDKANRLRQALFRCTRCAFSGAADHCAARVIAARARAAVMRPNVGLQTGKVAEREPGSETPATSRLL